MEDQTKRPAADELSLDEIIAELDKRYDGRLPERALREAQRRREEITPRLIEVIRKAAETARAGEVPQGDGPLFALYLLTEFRAKEALPAILEAVSISADARHDLFGGAITEDFGRILASLAEDSPETVDRLVGDPSLDDFVRWPAAGAWLYLVRDGRMTRDEAVERLRERLRAAMTREETGEIVGGLICELVDFAPREALDEIEEAFRLGLVDESLIDMATIRQSVAMGDAWFRQSQERCPPTGIEDTVEELRGWASFQEHPSAATPPALRDTWGDDGDDWNRIARRDPSLDEAPPGPPVAVAPIRNTGERVGRNDPCPCGSGKKYKKCCGAS